MRQLAAHAAVRQGVARALPRPRARRRRRARARVRLRARPRQRAPRGRRARRRLPGRHRQRLRDLAVVRQPLLAGGLPRRRRRSRPLPALRRGGLRGDRAGDPAAPGRRRGARRASTPAASPRPADWDSAAVPGDLPRLRPRRAPHDRRPASRRSTSGRSPASGRSSEEAAVLDGGRRARSPTASRRRDVNLVLAPPAPARRSASPCASTASRPATTTGSTSTRPARARSPSRGMYQLIRQRGPVRPAHVRDHVPRRRACARTSSPSADELLAAVDVVRRARERRVGHQVHGERRDVVRADHPPDRQRRRAAARGARRAGRRAGAPTTACRRSRRRSG